MESLKNIDAIINRIAGYGLIAFVLFVAFKNQMKEIDGHAESSVAIENQEHG
jgi:hypothetical protein